MKYLVLLLDGAADRPVDELGGKTPLECAYKPNIDGIASLSETGMVKTVPDGFKPGSDVANLSALGFDPRSCYTGRSPLEAASLGVDLSDSDVCLRCNLVTLSDEENYRDKKMVDYCGGDIHTDEAEVLINYINEKLGNDKYRFYPGFSYRHCLVVKNGTTDLGGMTPPHDISGRTVGGYLSTSENARELIEIMKKSFDLLKDHPINIKRKEQGLRPANSVWFWGEGTKPKIENFRAKNGVSGAVVSAVDLLKGIGICAGMTVAEVPGATGYIDSNFTGKAEAAKKLFCDNDLVFLHLEAPDECGHRGETMNKVKSIEIIDKLIAGPMLEFLKPYDHRVLVMPDHPTPLCIRTHSSDPVPFIIYDSTSKNKGPASFTEENAGRSGIYIENGFQIMSRLLNKESLD